MFGAGSLPGIFAAARLKRAGIGFVTVLFLIVSHSVIAELSSSDVSADWIKVSAGDKFNLMAPAGTKFHPAQGVDSFVGSFAAPDFKLSFDYGRFSDPLIEFKRDAEYETRTVRIDGKEAHIVAAYAPRVSADQPYFIGVHFPEIKKSTLGATKLTVYALLETAENYPVVEKIFSTIHFE